MVDWEAVERLRSKGWDWDRIAGDPNVEFTAASGGGEAGRQLRALYYQRRSKAQRRGSDGPKGSKSDKVDDRTPWTLLRVAYILLPLFAVWLVIAYAIPSPVGVYLPAFPDLLILTAVAAAATAFGLLRTSERWTPTYRNSAVIGVVVGLVFAGGFGLAAVSQGCPTLSPAGSVLPSEGANPTWTQYSSNPKWTSGGAPVFFFYGSIACPFCSASSWAFYWALERFGSLQGLTLGHSSSTDTYANTPELEFVNAQYSSSYIAIHILESNDDSSTTPPAPASCTDQAYVSAYDGGSAGIPFVVVGGQYVHVGTVVNPAQLQPLGLAPSTVLGQVLNQSGSAWDLVQPNAYMLAAIFLKADGGQPASVLSQYPSVAADYNAI